MTVMLVVVLFKAPSDLPWLPDWMDELCEVLGYAMLVTAALWRIWCALFIAGTKNGELASEGPYSVVRNPLYIGNFLGAVGFGFAVEQPLLGLVLGLVFVLGYPAVVKQEEAKLTQIFGERYQAYCRRVPRWIPDWSLYREPEQMTISPKHVRSAILDAQWFLWAFGVAEFIEELHSLKILPALL